MAEEWKSRFAGKMEDYSGQAPEGLFEDIMSSIDAQRPEIVVIPFFRRFAKPLILTGAAVAAAAAVILAVLLPSSEPMPDALPLAEVIDTKESILPEKTDKADKTIGAAVKTDGDDKTGGEARTDGKTRINAETDVKTVIETDVNGKAESKADVNGKSDTDDKTDGKTGINDKDDAKDKTENKVDRKTDEKADVDGKADDKSDGKTGGKKDGEKDGKKGGEKGGKKEIEKTEEDFNVIDNGSMTWQDILLADAGKSGVKENRFALNVFAAGIPSSTQSVSAGYAPMDTRANYTPAASQFAYMSLLNRDKEVNTSTRHFLPIRAGLSFAWYFAPKWKVETGVSYAYLRSKSFSGSENYYFDARQELHYIGIPLNIGYDILNHKVVDLYVSAGGIMEKCVDGRTTSDYWFDGDKRSSDVEKTGIRPLQWSVQASAGLQFNLVRNLGLYIEPGVVYHFKNGSPVESSYTKQPFNFNLNLGFRFSL